jgi:DNA polymerase III delta subunit
MTDAPPTLAWYHGDDAYGLDRAADALYARLAAAEPALDRVRVRGDATTAATLAAQVATAPLFGGGTFIVVVEPGPLLRKAEDRDTLLALIRSVAPGNALVFLEPDDGSNRPAAGIAVLQKAVQAAGGEVRQLRAPRAGQLAGWIEQRARERGIRFGPGAARELTTRIGGFVQEGDVDRRAQVQQAVAELDKLALYRPDGAVSTDDVRALVAEAVPGSAWAFLDAVGLRRVPRALELLERLLDATPELVILAQLHRRIRELLEVADRLASRETPGSLVQSMKLKPFRAERLVEQARAWTLPELDDALEGLVELDFALRGSTGNPSHEAQRRLAFVLWVGERVGGSTVDRPAVSGAA